MPKSSKHKSKTAGAKLRQIRKPGDIDTLKKKLWQAVIAAEDLLLHSGADFNQQIKAVHALQQACTAYAKLLETADLAERLAQLEEAIEAQQQVTPLRKVS